MFTGNTYLVRGDESSIPELTRILRDEGIRIEGNSDVYMRTYPHFGIDEARELTARAYGKSMTGSRRVFIAIFPIITAEAQNALLKTLEEPPSDALFLLITPSPMTLLPTLRSRAQMLDLGVSDASVVDTAKFLKAKVRERIDMLKPLLEKNDDDRRDIGNIIMFLSSVERRLAEMRHSSEESTSARRAGLESVYRARMYAGDKGSLLKPLLEQVALLVPVL